ncbi:Tat pathway signal protein [Brevundimonas sp. BH3]|uniref:Tat pathway signal protein n=1 Tax=Brevundimonas sp. BH3 TaxID=3133089 RepID=UPI003243A398
MDRRALLMFMLVASIASKPALASPKGEAKSGGGEMPMPLATATVLRTHGRRGVMSVESTLVFTDGALLEHAKLSRPRLNAAFNEAVRSEATHLLAGALPDVESLTRALQRAADRVLGRTGARVMLGAVMVT